MTGLVSKTLAWIEHPKYTKATTAEWAGFVALVLIAGFLWTTVIRTMEV